MKCKGTRKVKVEGKEVSDILWILAAQGQW